MPRPKCIARESDKNIQLSSCPFTEAVGGSQMLTRLWFIFTSAFCVLKFVLALIFIYLRGRAHKNHTGIFHPMMMHSANACNRWGLDMLTPEPGIQPWPPPWGEGFIHLNHHTVHHRCILIGNWYLKRSWHMRCGHSKQHIKRCIKCHWVKQHRERRIVQDINVGGFRSDDLYLDPSSPIN